MFSRFLFLSFFSEISAKLTVNTDSAILPLNPRQFDAQIGKQRGWQVGVIYFHDHSSSSKTAFKTLTGVAKDLEGMFRFAAVDCDEHKEFCKSNALGELPSVVVYPRNPQPSYRFDKAGESLNGDALKKGLVKLLTSEHVTVFEDQTKVDSWLKQDGSIPKVILFSQSLSVSALYKAISNDLRKEMHFGLIQYVEGSAIANKFKVKKAPTLLVSHKGKVDIYKGALNFKDIHAWANIHRETFVKGGGFDHQSGDAEPAKKKPKPWLEEEFPEIRKESGGDVCFKGDSLCLIYLKEGDSLTNDETTMLRSLKAKFDGQLNIKWSWINMQTEVKFAELFSPESLPSAVVFNPHKRLRFASLPDGFPGDNKGIQELLERVTGGDARFTGVKGQVLPAYAVRKTPKEEL